MRQYLLRLLQVLYFELLLEELVLFFLQVQGGFLLVRVELFDLLLELFALLLELLGDVADRLGLLTFLGDFGADLLLVVPLLFNVILQLRDLLVVAGDHFLILFRELRYLLLLVLLLGSELLLVLSLEVVGDLLTVFVGPLHVLQLHLEVIEQLLNIPVVSLIKPLNLVLEVAFHFVLGLAKLA